MKNFDLTSSAVSEEKLFPELCANLLIDQKIEHRHETLPCPLSRVEEIAILYLQLCRGTRLEGCLVTGRMRLQTRRPHDD